MNPTVASRRRLVSVIGAGLLTALAVTATTAATLTSPVDAAGAVPSSITDSDIAQAGMGVMAFGLRNIAVDPITEPCPMLSQDRIAWHFAQQAYTPNFTGFAVDVYYDDEVGEGYPGVDCISQIEDAITPDPVAPHYPAVGAAYLPDGVTFADFLTTFEDQAILTPSVPGIAGQVGGVCISSFCYLHWNRGTLVVSVLVAGGSGDITQAKTEAMLTAMVPEVVANLKASLATGAPIPGSTTTSSPTQPSTLPTLPTPSVPEPTKTVPS